MARHRIVGRDHRRRREAGRGGRRARPPQGFRRKRACRPARRAAARPSDEAAGPLPAALGGDAARPRPPHRPAARGAPPRVFTSRNRSRWALPSSTAGSWAPGRSLAGRSCSTHTSDCQPAMRAPSSANAPPSRHFTRDRGESRRIWPSTHSRRRHGKFGLTRQRYPSPRGADLDCCRTTPGSQRRDEAKEEPRGLDCSPVRHNLPYR